nr:MAG TPA: hypothetical protein [Crassvirales sp.]
MEKFKNINRDYVSPINLETLSKTYDTLEQGHKEAVKAASDLEVAIANMDLDESEDAWKQGKINEIKNTIANNTIYGNSYAALDNIIVKSGDLGSDAGLLGRLQANKDHKAFEAKIDAMDMPQDYKDMYKELNPYTYQDKIDKNGKVIGGTRWTPNVSPTKVIPMNQIMNQALQWAAKESGGGTQTKFIDTEGNLSSTYTPGSEMAVFSTTTGSWQRLTKDKIRKAVEAAIANTPGAKESIDQDYNVQLWHANKKEENDVTDRNGILMTKEQYLESRLNPFYDAASFYNSQSSVTYNKNWQNELALARRSRSGSGSGSDEELGRKFNAESTKAGIVVTKNIAPEQAQAAVTTSKIKLRQYLGNDYIIDDKDIDTIKDDIKSIKNPTDRYEALKALRDYENNNDYINSITENADSDTKGAIKTLLAITTGSDMPTDNDSKKWKDKWNNRVNEIFGTNGIRQYCKDKDTYDTIIANLGGIEQVKSYGFNAGYKNGKYYIDCPKSAINNYYAFAKAAKNGIEETKGIIGGYNSNPIHRLNADGTDYEYPILGDENPDGINIYNRSINLVDRMSNKKNIIMQGSDAVYEINSSAYVSPKAFGRQIEFETNPTSENKNLLANATESAIQNLKGGVDLVQNISYKLDSKTNQFTKIDSNEAKKLTELIKVSNANDLTLNFAIDPISGQPAGLITIKGYSKEGEVKTSPTSILVPGLFNDDEITGKLMRDTSIRSSVRIGQSMANKAPISLTSDIPTIDNFNLIPNENGTFNIVKGSGNNKEIIATVTSDKASTIYDKMLQYEDIVDYIQAGLPVKEEALQSMIESIAVTISNLEGSNDEDVIAYNAKQLLNNIIGQ